MRRFRQWRQLAPQLNEIAISIVPILQDRKIAGDLVNISHSVRPRTVKRVGFYIESGSAEVDTRMTRLGLVPGGDFAPLHRVPAVLARRRASPRGGQIGWGQRILRVLIGDGAIRG